MFSSLPLFQLGSDDKMLFLEQLSFIFLFVVGVVTAATQRHDETFVPDAVLRITVQNISQSCLPPKSVVLVNGTSPGPELRLLEGHTYWIRVYNDMPDQNLTIVSTSSKREWTH
jgi:L-ascorbate oxidase